MQHADYFVLGLTVTVYACLLTSALLLFPPRDRSAGLAGLLLLVTVTVFSVLASHWLEGQRVFGAAVIAFIIVLAVLGTYRILFRTSRADSSQEVFNDEATICLSCGAELPSSAPRCPSCGWSYDGAGTNDK